MTVYLYPDDKSTVYVCTVWRKDGIRFIYKFTFSTCSLENDQLNLEGIVYQTAKHVFLFTKDLAPNEGELENKKDEFREWCKGKSVFVNHPDYYEKEVFLEDINIQ